MQVKWLVEDFDPDNNSQRLIEEIQRQNYQVEVIKYLPYESGNYNQFKDEDCVIFQGSLQLARQLQKQKKWIPTVWLNLHAYECSTYYAYLGEYLFNDNYIMLPRTEVKRRILELYEKYGKNELVLNQFNLFIRPSSGFKTFTGKVFERENFEDDWQWVEEFTEPESLIVISSAKNILKEWRFVVCDKKIITGSIYRDNRQSVRKQIDLNSINDKKAYEKAYEVAQNEFEPDSVYVIDICMGGDHDCYLLEIGSFCCAGLYACDLEKTVKVVSERALKEWGEYYEKVV